VGLAVAVEVAAPVLPVLVALDWATEAPVVPVVAVGLVVSVADPPAARATRA
jgi:hypothetical protein